MKNIYEILKYSTHLYSDKTAFIFQNQKITYAVLKEATERLASGLKKHGMKEGDRIALMLPNIPHFVMSYFAILKIGAIVVPVPTHCKSEEIHHQLEEAEIKGIIYWERYRDEVSQMVRGLDQCQKKMVLGEKAIAGEIRLNYLMETSNPLEQIFSASEDDTALIVYTDRMKGRSKGAELTHRNVLSNIEVCAKFFQLTPEDGTIGVVPFYHMLGQTLIMGAFLASGGQIALLPKFQPDTLFRTIKENKLTYFIGVPYMYETLLKQSDLESSDLASIKICLSCGDALKQETMDAFEDKFKIPILEGYGLTEASPMVSFHSVKGERKAGSIGIPLPGIDLKIMSENNTEVIPGKIGEIVVQGPNVMKGYLNRPEATKDTLRNGWLHTGDLALLDESGHAYIVGRKRNVITKSGFAVFPNEIEDYLNTHPKIQEAVVVGLPDPVQGEEIYACAVFKADETATPKEIIEFLSEKIPVYKCPKTILFVSALPKGPTGRVIRDQVKQIILDVKDNWKK